MDSRPGLPALTAIRFLATMHVVFFHYSPGLPGILGNIKGNGFLAVSLFFVLSGFVLAYNYAGCPLDQRRFWIARFARIYPAYLLAFFLISPAMVVRLHDDPEKLAFSGLAALTLLQSWIAGQALVWNGPGWSLACEAFFYAIFPFVLPIMARRPLRSLCLAGTGCWLIAVIPPVATYIPLFRLAEFLLGVATGLLFLRAEHPARLIDWLLGGSCTALVLFAALSTEWIPPIPRNAAAAPLFAIFIFALSAHRGILARLSSWPPFSRLGDASYAVYILQSPILAYFLFVTRGIGASSARNPLGWGEFLVYCAILIATSLACHAWIETPARRWIITKWRVGLRPTPRLGRPEAYPTLAKRTQQPRRWLARQKNFLRLPQ